MGAFESHTASGSETAVCRETYGAEGLADVTLTS